MHGRLAQLAATTPSYVERDVHVMNDEMAGDISYCVVPDHIAALVGPAVGMKVLRATMLASVAFVAFYAASCVPLPWLEPSTKGPATLATAFGPHLIHVTGFLRWTAASRQMAVARNALSIARAAGISTAATETSKAMAVEMWSALAVTSNAAELMIGTIYSAFFFLTTAVINAPASAAVSPR